MDKLIAAIIIGFFAVFGGVLFSLPAAIILKFTLPVLIRVIDVPVITERFTDLSFWTLWAILISAKIIAGIFKQTNINSNTDN